MVITKDELTVPQTAQLLKVSRQAVHNMIEDGRLTVTRWRQFKTKRSPLIERVSIEQERQRREGEAPAL